MNLQLLICLFFKVWLFFKIKVAIFRKILKVDNFFNIIKNKTRQKKRTQISSKKYGLDGWVVQKSLIAPLLNIKMVLTMYVSIVNLSVLMKCEPSLFMQIELPKK